MSEFQLSTRWKCEADWVNEACSCHFTTSAHSLTKLRLIFVPPSIFLLSSSPAITFFIASPQRPPFTSLSSFMSRSTPYQPVHASLRSPYFLLPNPSLLDDAGTYTPPPNSIKQIYGKIEHMSDRKQADFLLRLMAHSNTKPDFAAMATAIGLPNESAV
jgi:hypothetical protein